MRLDARTSRLKRNFKPHFQRTSVMAVCNGRVQQTGRSMAIMNRSARRLWAPQCGGEPETGGIDWNRLR